MSQAQLSLVTRGKILNPRVSTLEAIARALGVPPGDLLGEPTGYDGVLLIPLIAFGADGTWYETDEMRPIASALMKDPGRKVSTVVTTSGGAPYVLPGDEVIVNVDRPIELNELILVRCNNESCVAFYVREGVMGPVFQRPDGTIMPIGVDVIGVVASISRTPPRYQA